VKFGKVVLLEIVFIAVVLIVILISIEGIPTLGSTGQNNSVGMYQEKNFKEGQITLAVGQTQSTRFNYTSFDPAIMQIDLNFLSIQSSANLTLYCNGRVFTSIIPTIQNPHVTLTVFSVSGTDWVQTLTTSNLFLGSTFLYGNEIAFASSPLNGFEGTFSYTITIRGSR
jgi:hypothetical protein